MQETAGAAADGEAVGACGEVAGVELVAAEVFDVREGLELGAHFGWGEEELEGFAGERDAAGEGVVRELLGGGEDVAGLAVVEDDAGAGRAGRDDGQGGAEGVKREIGDDTEPGEEGGDGGVEAGAGELGGEALALEVNGNEGGGGGQVEGGGYEEVLLPGLGGGVIDLEDAEGGRAIAEGEGVEAGAEEDVLCGAVGAGVGEGVLGEAGAGDEEGAEGVGVRAVRAGGGALELLGVDRAENGDGERVGEDEGVGVDELVGGTAEGDAERGAGWGGQVHGGSGQGDAGETAALGQETILESGIAGGSKRSGGFEVIEVLAREASGFGRGAEPGLGEMGLLKVVAGMGTAHLGRHPAGGHGVAADFRVEAGDGEGEQYVVELGIGVGLVAAPGTVVPVEVLECGVALEVEFGADVDEAWWKGDEGGEEIRGEAVDGEDVGEAVLRGEAALFFEAGGGVVDDGVKGAECGRLIGEGTGLANAGEIAEEDGVGGGEFVACVVCALLVAGVEDELARVAQFAAERAAR